MANRYEIRVRGQLSQTLLQAFPPMDVHEEDTVTVLTGPLPDQSALYGVLTQIEGLHLELVQVRLLEP